MAEREGSPRLVYGVHPVRLALRRARLPGARLLLLAGGDRRRDALERSARAGGITVHRCERSNLEDLVGSVTHQGAVLVVPECQVPEADAWSALLARIDRADPARPSLVLALDEVQDPHNLGACLRTAAAVAADAVVVPRHRAAGSSATVSKVAAGAADLVPLVAVSNLSRALEALRNRGLHIVGAHAGAERTVYQADLREPTGIVLGGEARGLRRLVRASCEELVRIPMPGEMESLNVSVAAGVLLFEALRQRSDALNRPAP